MQMKLMMPEKATLNNIEVQQLQHSCFQLQVHDMSDLFTINSFTGLVQASVLNMARAKKHGSGGSNLTGP